MWTSWPDGMAGIPLCGHRSTHSGSQGRKYLKMRLSCDQNLSGAWLHFLNLGSPKLPFADLAAGSARLGCFAYVPHLRLQFLGIRTEATGPDSAFVARYSPDSCGFICARGPNSTKGPKSPGNRQPGDLASPTTQDARELGHRVVSFARWRGSAHDPEWCSFFMFLPIWLGRDISSRLPTPAKTRSNHLCPRRG